MRSGVVEWVSERIRFVTCQEHVDAMIFPCYPDPPNETIWGKIGPTPCAPPPSTSMFPALNVRPN